jgi:hypothetical protein
MQKYIRNIFSLFDNISQPMQLCTFSKWGCSFTLGWIFLFQNFTNFIQKFEDPIPLCPFSNVITYLWSNITFGPLLSWVTTFTLKWNEIFVRRPRSLSSFWPSSYARFIHFSVMDHVQWPQARHFSRSPFAIYLRHTGIKNNFYLPWFLLHPLVQDHLCYQLAPRD